MTFGAMTSQLKAWVMAVVHASRTRGRGLTMIGVGMLISTNVAETIRPVFARELTLIAIIAAGLLATTHLYSKPQDRRLD